MASILRSGKFIRHFSGFARSLIINTPREAESNIFQHSQLISSSFSHGFASVSAKTDQNLEKSLKRLDQDVRRAGRITRRDIEEVLEEIRLHRSATSSQSLLVIRCCGNLVPEELPEVRTTLVQEIWKTLNKLNVPMDISHYNALLRVYLENEHDFSPAEFLKDLEAKGVEPNRVTYQRLISRYCQQGDIEGATKILEYMREKQLPINEHVFNALIQGHSEAEDMESAFGMLSVMKQAGLEPSSDTYTILLCCYAKIGDIEAIEKTLKTCEENEIFLLDKDVMDAIYVLAVNGHANKVDSLIEKLRKMSGFNQDAVNVILRLTNKGQEDVAHKILKTMPRGSRPDGELTDTGTFFIKQMVRANCSTEKIKSICSQLQESGLNRKPFLVAVEASVTGGNMKMSFEFLRELRALGQPIRPHYFWPLICAQGRVGIDGLVELLRCMQDEFGITLNSETIREYVMPNLKEKNHDKIIAMLRDVGVSTATATTSLVHHLLTQAKIKEAADLACNYSLYYQPALFRSPLVHALGKTNDFNSFIRILRQIYDCIPRLDKLLQSRSNDDDTMDEPSEVKPNQDRTEMIGQFVFEAFNNFRNDDRVAALTTILEGLLDQGLSISNAQAERIQEKLGSNVTPEISSLLGQLTAGDLEPIPMSRPISNRVTSSYATMTPNQLIKILDAAESKGDNTKGIKRWLLSVCFKSKDITQTEQIVERCEKSEDFVMTDGIYAQLIDFYCLNENVDKALAIFNRIKADNPIFQIDEIKTIRIVSLLVANGRINDAIQHLETNRIVDPQPEERGFNYTTTCWRLLNALAETGNVENLNRVYESLETNGFVEPNNVLLGPLVKVHIVNNDLKKAIDTFEQISHRHNCTPWKNDLACKLIQAEDGTNLQRLTDLSTNVHGEVNSLYDLVFSFVECGRIRQARKILETPGLRSRTQRIHFACERYRQEGMVESLEGLIEATRDLNHIDRSDIFYNLLLSYTKDENPNKALGLWTKMQEEDITPSDQFLQKLDTFLRSKNVDVPFVVSKPTSTPVAENRRRTAEPIDQESGGLTKRSREIERLVQANRISDAKQMALSMLDDNVYPIPRIFRYFLNKCAEAGDVDYLEKISGKLSADVKRTFSFDNRLCHAYVRANRTDEYLVKLEQDLTAATNDTDFAKLSEQFPRGGAIGLLENNPDIVGKYEALAEKYAARNCVGPINVLWMHHFVNGNFEEANRIWKKYLANTPRVMFQKILGDAKKALNEDMLFRLIDQLRAAKVNERGMGVVYSAILDIYASKQMFDKGMETINLAMKDVSLEQFNRTALTRIRDGIEAAGKKFPHKIPDKQSSNGGIDEDITSSSSSSSSSSSDDEEPVKSNK